MSSCNAYLPDGNRLIRQLATYDDLYSRRDDFIVADNLSSVISYMSLIDVMMIYPPNMIQETMQKHIENRRSSTNMQEGFLCFIPQSYLVV